MKSSLLLLCFLAVLPGLARADRGADLLAKVKARYATCETFSCRGDLTTVSNMLDQAQPFKSEKRFTIAFQRPALLRVDWLEPSSSTFTPVACSLYTQNKKYYGVSSFKRTPHRFATLDEGIAAYAGISGGVTYGIPFLLLSKKGYFSNAACRLGRDSTVNGRACSVLEVMDPTTGHWILSIAKDDYAILRSRQIHALSAKEIQKIRTETRRTWKAKNIPFPDLLTSDRAIEITTNYSAVTFNRPMQPSGFVFRVPSN